ncbi:MAG: zinc-ribbon domain-containing protein [Gammaproteobacteria bacterium]|nr:zinc-ribbon domain-containing protein [Gammaproteobacteria bacterium]
MFTRCPTCQTVFRVHAETLRVAQGQVRCGRCGAQFNALDSLTEAPEALVVPAETAEVEAVAHAETGDVSAEAARVETQPELCEPAVAAPGPEFSSESSPESALESAPEPSGQVQSEASPGLSTEREVPELSAQAIEAAGSPAAETATVGPEAAPPSVALAPEVIQEALLIEEPAPRPAGPRVLGGLALLVLLAVLGGQWLYLQRAPLYERTALRPVLQRFCAVLGCDLPLPRLPERIEVVERVVREHPRVAQALLVDLSFVSRADRVIAYPVLELRLTDVSGNRVAARRFAPQDYLSPGVDVRAGVRPGQPVQVTLEVVAPQFEAVSFQFEFL